MTDTYAKQPADGKNQDQIAEPDLNCKSGTFSYQASQLKPISNTDNMHLEGKSYRNSTLIINEFGGVNNIIEGLLTNAETGISKDQIEDRKRIYGENFFPPPPIKSLYDIIMDNFKDPINQILIVAAIVSAVIGLSKEGFPKGLIEGTSICIALTIIISVGSSNEYIATKRLSAMLASADETKVTVLRGSSDKASIDSADLVVGDLIEIKNGQKMPADCLLVSGQGVKCRETDLTGEPDDFAKEVLTEDTLENGTSPVILAKSECTAGFGQAIVIAVGTNTASGEAAARSAEAAAEQDQTHLQEKLEAITLQIGKVGFGVAILTCLSQVIRICLEMWKVTPGCCSNIFTCQVKKNCEVLDFGKVGSQVYLDLLDSVIISITVVVVAIPEGLPLAVTIALSFASAKMRDLNNLVRKLASAETMGGATHICSDKTGTLTKNDMTVMSIMTSEQIVEAGKTWNKDFVTRSQSALTEKTVADTEQNVWDLVKQSILWNTDVYLEKGAKDGFKLVGNVTEQGIFKFFMTVLSGEEISAEQNRLSQDNLELDRIAFTSSRKKASVVVRQPQHEGTDREVRIYTKGGPEFIIGSVTKFLAANGEEQEIDAETVIPDFLAGRELAEGTVDNTHRAMIEKSVKHFAAQAYRTILCCYRDMSMDDFEALKAEHNNFETDEDREILENELTACAIFGLQDPLRDGIRESIESVRTAGIRVIMCTGDNLDTATAISLNAGIIKPNEVEKEYSCLLGEQFRELVEGLETDKEGKTVVKNVGMFKRIKKNLRVMGRCSPIDKLILVTGYQNTEGVVAVTGDGTNDAPALTKADVGFSMGITGTDVAKGASDIILMDDNFNSIVVALKFGRSVFDNVRKFLQFQLTVNVVAMFIVFFGAVVLKDMPLNAVQMLWVNLIMDTFAALALATEPPEPEVLTRPPYHKDAAIVTDVMWRNVFGHSIYQMIVLIVVILAAQGPNGLVQFYEYQCRGETLEGGVCDGKGFNPFFTRNLYYGSKQDWFLSGDQTSVYTLDALKKEYPINAAPLEEWRCTIYNYKFGFKEEDTDIKKCSQKVANYNEKVGNLYPFSDLTKSESEDKDLEDIPTEKALHFTYVFQIFVFMQLFNQVNGRKLGANDYNVFQGMCANMMFLVIAVCTFFIQVLMVQFGGRVTKTEALTLNQNLICLAIGAGELVWGVLIKFLPLNWFSCLSIPDAPLTEDQMSGFVGQSILRKSNNKKAVTSAGDQK